jgi:NAD(P)-dependent dehydrogenase (short-subunit alcohol dehydrogenase family)
MTFEMGNPFSLSDKTVFVTGASSGIGRSVAIECSKMGAKLVITGRNKDRLDETFRNLSGEGHISITADIVTGEGIAKIAGALPLLDGIVHSAGVYKLAPVSFANEEMVREVMDINFLSPLALTQQILKLKKVNKNASVVFISSIAGSHVSSPGGSVYSASKSALIGMMRGMALDLAPRGIRVNTVAPGTIQTGIFDGSAVSHDQLSEDVKRYPLRRYGRPEEVAYSVIYLLSDASAWVTGSNIVIDGGFTLL